MTKTSKRGYWRNLLIFSVCVSGLLGVGVLAYFSYQGTMTYLHPPRFQRLPDDDPDRFGVDYRDVTLQTQDGVMLSAWYTSSRNGSVILVAHGYGVARSAEMHALFARHGYGVVSWDARAHGASGGELCSLGYYERLDAEAALDFALSQPGVAHVGAFGQSMGAATVIKAAVERAEIEAVVADSAFPAVDDMLDQAVPIPLLRPLTRFFIERETGLTAADVRPVDDIRRISPRPVFIIQGAEDSVIPADSAQRLYAAAGEPRQVWVGAGAGHVGVFDQQPEDYTQRVIGFFDKTLLIDDSLRFSPPSTGDRKPTWNPLSR